jgi:pyruvate,water dikinase
MALTGVDVAQLVLGPTAASAAGEGRVGGKAAGLARLHAAGAAVPPWFVVAADALGAHLDAAGLRPEVEAALGALAALPADDAATRARLEAASAQLRPRVAAIRPTAGLAASVTAALRELGPGPYAVRSSMVGEDAATRSFAGQLESFLYRHDAAAVLAAITRCWASAFSPRALAYRRGAGAATAVPAVGVVVQRMVTGRVSGVLFTTDPVSGRADQARVSACWGLCDGVVNGSCNTDEFVVDRAGVEVEVRVAEKDLQVAAAAGADGTREVEVPADRRGVRCLQPAEVTRLCAAARDLAQALGGPLDMEWTIEGDAIWFLQARPITATGAGATAPATGAGATATPTTSAPSPAAATAAGPRVVWDNSNIQESYCGVTTPLTFSFARGAYASVYEQFLRAVGVAEDVIEEYHPVFRQLLGLVRGRVYYNINNWYRLLLVLPGFGRNKHDMERMMGVDHPVDFVADQVLGPLEKLRRVPRLAWTGVTLKARFLHLERDVDRFLADFETAYRSVDRGAFVTLPLAELMTTRARLEREILGNWHTPIINDLYVMQANGNLRRLVERAVGTAEAPRVQSHILGGQEGIESTEPTRFLLRLAATARRDPALRAALTAGTPAAAITALRAGFPDFAAALDEYLERYGDRCIGELKLETISLREDPSFVVHALRNYLERPDLDADRLLQQERRDRAAAEAEVRGRLPLHLRLGFADACEAARRGVKLRENMRLCRTRGFGLYRDLHRAIGLRLHEAGRLDHPRDVFYLTVDEIEGYCDGTGVSADLGALARARRAEYAAYERQELPHRFETRGPVHHGNDYAPSFAQPADPRARLLRGTGCYPGVVEAPAKVIMGPRDDLSLTGKILVTLRTDPGWAPLFPSAAGILVERGSTLSHSAILARELGIPAVVGVPNLLAVVRDGEQLRLDGATGTVERLEVPAP